MITILSLTASQLCKKLGEALRVARLNKDLTQKDIAYLIKCSLPTIKKIESGNIRVAIIYIMRYIEATQAHEIINGLDTFQQQPKIYKTQITYAKRIKKSLLKRTPS